MKTSLITPAIVLTYILSGPISGQSLEKNAQKLAEKTMRYGTIEDIPRSEGGGKEYGVEFSNYAVNGTIYDNVHFGVKESPNKSKEFAVMLTKDMGSKVDICAIIDGCDGKPLDGVPDKMIKEKMNIFSAIKFVVDYFNSDIDDYLKNPDNETKELYKSIIRTGF